MKTIRIKLNDSVSGVDYEYAAGLTVDAPEERAKDLIRAGYATQVGNAAEQREKAIPNTDKKEKR